MFRSERSGPATRRIKYGSRRERLRSTVRVRACAAVVVIDPRCVSEAVRLALSSLLSAIRVRAMLSPSGLSLPRAVAARAALPSPLRVRGRITVVLARLHVALDDEIGELVVDRVVDLIANDAQHI
jgi:hypothetical protein